MRMKAKNHNSGHTYQAVSRKGRAPPPTKRLTHIVTAHHRHVSTSHPCEKLLLFHHLTDGETEAGPHHRTQPRSRSSEEARLGSCLKNDRFQNPRSHPPQKWSSKKGKLHFSIYHSGEIFIGKKEISVLCHYQKKHGLSELFLKQRYHHLGGPYLQPERTNIIIRATRKLPQQIWKEKRDCSFQSTKLPFQIK